MKPKITIHEQLSGNKLALEAYAFHNFIYNIDDIKFWTWWKLKKDTKNSNDIDIKYQKNFSHYMNKELKDDSFIDFLILLSKNKVCVFSKEIDTIRILYNIYKYKSDWIRDINMLKKKSHNVEKQLHELIKHLFVKYNVAKFLYNVFANNFNAIPLFIHLTNGGSLKKYKNIEILNNLNDKMRHVFLTAEDSYFSINEAYRYAQVIGMGGNDRLAYQILSGKLKNISTEKTIQQDKKGNLYEVYEKELFLTSIIQWFCNQPMIDYNQINPIIDYILTEKYERQNFVRNGKAVFEIKNPHFELKGRTADSLIRLSEEWHNALSKLKNVKNEPKSWNGYNIENWQYSVGKDSNLIIYDFTELKKNYHLKARFYVTVLEDIHITVREVRVQLFQ